MFDGGGKGILGEVNSSNFCVVGQGIDDGLDRIGGCCLFSRRHDVLNGLFSFLDLNGMVRAEGRTMMEVTNRWEGLEMQTCLMAHA